MSFSSSFERCDYNVDRNANKDTLDAILSLCCISPLAKYKPLKKYVENSILYFKIKSRYKKRLIFLISITFLLNLKCILNIYIFAKFKRYFFFNDDKASLIIIPGIYACNEDYSYISLCIIFVLSI